MLSLGASIALAITTAPSYGEIIEVFGPTVTDLSTFTTVSGDGVDALVSVQGAPGSELLSLLDNTGCLLYTSPSPRDQRGSRMPSSA